MSPISFVRFIIATYAALGAFAVAHAQAHVPPIPIQPDITWNTKCPFADGVWGCAEIYPDHADVWILPKSPYWVLRHEYGHIYEYFELDGDEHYRWRKAIYPRATAWKPFVAERFADAYARCYFHRQYIPGTEEVTRRQYVRGCELIWKFAP